MDKNEKQKEYRRRIDNIVTKRYERTKKGKLMRTYRNMLSRVVGILKLKRHLYNGLDILSKEEFYAWSIANPDFHSLFDEWEKQNYPIKLSPSIDRINSSLGYIQGNIRWVTHSENSLNGCYSRHRRVNKESEE